MMGNILSSPHVFPCVHWTAEPKRPSSILKKVNLQTEDEARLSLKRLSIPDSKSSSLATTPRHERLALGSMLGMCNETHVMLG